MTREEIFNNLKDILQVVRPNTDLSQAGFDTNLRTQLGIDSLSLMLLALAIEQKFNIKFETSQQFQTIGDVCDFVAGAVK